MGRLLPRVKYIPACASRIQLPIVWMSCAIASPHILGPQLVTYRPDRPVRDSVDALRHRLTRRGAKDLPRARAQSLER